MKKYLKLIRVEQYIKNLFVFAPLFFSGEFTTINLLEKTFVAFLSFCAIASCIYIFNDYFDVEEDRLHPIKKNRPLASGIISKKNAIILATGLSLIGLFLGGFCHPRVLCVLLIYLALNFLYTLILKKVALLDINIIAICFLLRILAGAIAADVVPSIWIMIETYLLALFLALAKRRTDFVLFTDGVKVRKNIKHYNLIFIDIILGILVSIITICYIFYCISPETQKHFHSKYILFSIIFVLNGLFRYLQLAVVDLTTYSPTEIILKDRFIQITILGWLLLLVTLLYFK